VTQVADARFFSSGSFQLLERYSAVSITYRGFLWLVTVFVCAGVWRQRRVFRQECTLRQILVFDFRQVFVYGHTSSCRNMSELACEVPHISAGEGTSRKNVFTGALHHQLLLSRVCACRTNSYIHPCRRGIPIQGSGAPHQCLGSSGSSSMGRTACLYCATWSTWNMWSSSRQSARAYVTQKLRHRAPQSHQHTF
jgi:hypothetical protein